jgi:hypothetical protein
MTQNYLSDRQQKVLVSFSSSQTLPVKAGVPQGSILGPLFFLLYINDIADKLLSVTRLFADDTSLAQTTLSVLDLEGILNHDLQQISQWSKRWLVTFNPDKTEALFFLNKQIKKLT